MTATAKKRLCPVAAGAEADSKFNQSEMYQDTPYLASPQELAQAKLHQLFQQPGFDVERFLRWDAGTFAEQSGLDQGQIIKIVRKFEKQQVASGYAVLKQWHDSIIIHPEMTAHEKIAALRIWSHINHQHRYAWPSQERIASELGYSRGSNFGKALRRSFEIGALSPVKVKNLPEEQRKLAVNVSRRSLRGTAYRLNPIDRWNEEAAQFNALQNSNRFLGGTLEGSCGESLNREHNNTPLRGISSNHITHPFNVESVFSIYDGLDDSGLGSRHMEAIK